MNVRVTIERFGQDIRNIKFGRNVRRKNYAFVNRVANPVISDFDVFRVLVYRVVEIDQSDSALVVDAQVDRFVGNDIELLEKNAKPGGRLCGMDS